MFSKLYMLLKESVVDDIVDRYLVLAALFLSLANWFIWHRFLDHPDNYIYTKFSIYPVQLLAIILTINTVLAVFSYSKEKEISYLLLTGNIIAVILVFALEIFYLSLMHQ